jgi:hypothetical protein
MPPSVATINLLRELALRNELKEDCEVRRHGTFIPPRDCITIGDEIEKGNLLSKQLQKIEDNERNYERSKANFDRRKAKKSAEIADYKKYASATQNFEQAQHAADVAMHRKLLAANARKSLNRSYTKSHRRSTKKNASIGGRRKSRRR